MSTPDKIQKLLFDDIEVRGAVVGLNESYEQALKLHPYPAEIKCLLGEMMAAVVLLSGSLKVEGRLTLQAQGVGAVRVLMAECHHKSGVRAIAHYDESVELPAGRFDQIFERGQIAITIFPDQGARYQGIVPMEGSTLAECLELYFRQSEQLPTHIQLQSDEHNVAGMMLQVMPGQGDEGEDWQRIRHLASTLKRAELLALDNETLLYRLFHEEKCRMFEAEPIAFRCDCSRERTADSLRFLGVDEVEEMLAADGFIEVACQFCSQLYRFDRVDMTAIQHGVNGAASASEH